MHILIVILYFPYYTLLLFLFYFLYFTGIILFSDPADVAVNGTKAENVYPNTIFLPGTGVQRGSTFIGDGDPLSPQWASVPNAYRYYINTCIG